MSWYEDVQIEREMARENRPSAEQIARTNLRQQQIGDEYVRRVAAAREARRAAK